VLRAAFAAALLTALLGCERPLGNAAAAEGGEEAAALTSPATSSATPGPLPSAVPTPTTSASPPMTPPSQDLVVRAHMQGATIKRGGDPVIVFDLEAKTPAPLVVPHPTQTTAAVTLRVTLPSGDVRVIYSAPRLPGVAPQLGNVRVLPGRVESFETHLGSSLKFDQAGPYTIALEYPWRPGQVWTGTLHFVVQ
jgi:hypothetical protein